MGNALANKLDLVKGARVLVESPSWQDPSYLAKLVQYGVKGKVLNPRPGAVVHAPQVNDDEFFVQFDDMAQGVLTILRLGDPVTKVYLEGPTSLSVSNGPISGPCRQCKRTCSSDERACWWCGVTNPV